MRCRSSPASSIRPSATAPPSTGSGGNLSTGLGCNVSYYSFNKPYQIIQGATYQNFLCDSEHARWWKAALEGGTLYFDAFGVRAELLISGSLFGSAILYMLGYILSCVANDYRYVYWSVLATFLGAVFLAAEARRRA